MTEKKITSKKTKAPRYEAIKEIKGTISLKIGEKRSLDLITAEWFLSLGLVKKV